MSHKWVSYRYRPTVSDGGVEFAELSAVTAPESLCQTERHFMTTIPAAWLELVVTIDPDDIAVHRAWFTCSGCHAQLESEYDASISR